MKNYRNALTLAATTALLCAAQLSMVSAARAQTPVPTAAPTATPFKPSKKSLAALAKQLKNVFLDVQGENADREQTISVLGTEVTELSQSFAQTLATKTSWSGNAVSGTSTGVTLSPINVTFTVNEDGTTGTWSSTPISLASLASGTFSGDWAIHGSAMYLFNITGTGGASGTLLITLPKPGKPVLSFQLGNISPPTFITLE